MSAELAMRRLLIMTNFKRKVMAVGMACILCTGAFAQRRGEDKQRPPKDNKPKVVVEPKQKPPQNNDRGGGKRNDGKKGRG
jgi:hypothetical protein